MIKWKILLEEGIGVTKGGFSGVSSAIWMGVALVVYNNYAKNIGVALFDSKLIAPFMFVCAGISFIYSAIINIRELRKSRKEQ